ncbi:hypothetical protein CHARACLAT_000456 [Characodon lateralis]|uniref:Uncharacterized protein n=1 Tax=Characodon lateralis TaxID=208331 RepID=A0ABU7DCC7_9TELE|nr:hypothetical protein [Characodon lateralis]
MEGVFKPQLASAAETQDDQQPKPDKNPEGLRQDHEQKSCPVNPDENDVTYKVLKDHDPPQEQPEVQTEDRFPTQTHDDSVALSEFSAVAEKKIQDEASCPYQNRTPLDLTSAQANQDEAEKSGGSVPALVVTEADQSCWSTAAPQRAERPADLVIPAAVSMTSLSSISDGGDVTYCDLQSPMSDSFSVTSEATVSRRSEEDDTRSVTASSVMSLFHRVQLDPLEKDWLKSSAVGNVAAQRLLLAQEPGLVLKKTALHWAAKQGRQEAVDIMLRSGADVNIRSVNVCVCVCVCVYILTLNTYLFLFFKA